MAADDIGATKRIAIPFFLLYCVPGALVIVRWPRPAPAEAAAVLATGLGLSILLVVACVLLPPSILRARGDAERARRWQYAALRASPMPMIPTPIWTFTRVADTWVAIVLAVAWAVGFIGLVVWIAKRYFPEYERRW